MFALPQWQALINHCYLWPVAHAAFVLHTMRAFLHDGCRQFVSCGAAGGWCTKRMYTDTHTQLCNQHSASHSDDHSYAFWNWWQISSVRGLICWSHHGALDQPIIQSDFKPVPHLPSYKHSTFTLTFTANLSVLFLYETDIKGFAQMYETYKRWERCAKGFAHIH